MANQRLIPSVDNKLIRWAEFINQDEGQSAGCNIIAKAMASGGLIVRSTNPDIGSLPDDVYDLDKLVKKLPVNLKTAVIEHYLHCDSLESQRLLACNCSRRTYFRRIASAHAALMMFSPKKKLRKEGSSVSSRIQKNIATA
jgi:hypothetical protein